MKKKYFLLLIGITTFIGAVMSVWAEPIVLFEDDFGQDVYDLMVNERLIDNGPSSQTSKVYDAIVGKWRLSDTGAPSEEQNGYITAEGYAKDSPSGRALLFKTRFDSGYSQMNYMAVFDYPAPREDLRITFAFMLPNAMIGGTFYANQGNPTGGPWGNQVFNFPIVTESSAFGEVPLSDNTWYLLQIDISVSTSRYTVTIFDKDHVQLGASAEPIAFNEDLTENIDRFQIHIKNGSKDGAEQAIYIDKLMAQVIPKS